jgi:pimeloyl-ACP methyl ester carboxylesterase
VAGVISLGGCVDLRLVAGLGLSAGAAVELLGGHPVEMPERWAFADPAQLPPPQVPVVLLHGADDELVPAEVSRSYAASSAGRGVRVDLQILTGVGHFELIDPTERAFDAVLAALDTLADRTDQP